MQSLLGILLLSCIVTNVRGFANNLVTTRSGCMIELDPIEVIMNSPVTPAQESDFPNFYVAVNDNDNYSKDNFQLTSETKQQLEIHFRNPYTKDEFHDDLQYVLDIVEGHAQFTNGGCENNRRIAGRLRGNDDDGGAELTIQDPTSTIRIVGGWSTGHEAVRLTPELVLLPIATSGGDSTAATKDEKERPKEGNDRNIDNSNKDIMNELESMMAQKKKKKPVAGERKIVPPVQTEKEQQEIRKQMEQDINRNFLSKFGYRQRYESDTKFHTSNHAYACIFFVCSMGIVYGMCYKKKTKSSRRDL